MKKRISVLALLAVMVTLLSSATAFAEGENLAADFVRNSRSMADKFGGVRFGADVLIGTGRCDDYAFCSGHDMEINSAAYSVAALLNFEAGYLWGERVFMGPTVSLSFGYPMFVSGALNYRLLIPVTDADAISFGVGFGMSYHVGYYDADYMDDYNVNYIYIPISAGFEHVFESGFTLGATVQSNLGFLRETKEKQFVNSKGEKESKGEISVSVVLGTFGVGVHLGYKW